MLSILINIYPCGEAVIGPEYFDVFYKPEWLEHEVIKRAIREVDKSELIYSNVIYSSIFKQATSPRELSGGVKTLACILNNPDKMFLGDMMGENCLPYLLEIGLEKDVTVEFTYTCAPPHGIPLYVRIANDGSIVHNTEELIAKYIEFFEPNEEEKRERAIEHFLDVDKIIYTESNSVSEILKNILRVKEENRESLKEDYEEGIITKEKYKELVELSDSRLDEDYDLINSLTEDDMDLYDLEK